MLRSIAFGLGLSALVLGVALGALGVFRHSAVERYDRAPFRVADTAVGSELLRAPLVEGQSFYAELCTPGVMAEEDFAGASFALRHVDDDVVVREVALDEQFFEHVRPVPSGTCGLLVSAAQLGVGGHYALTLSAAPADLPGARRPMLLRLVARSSIGLRDKVAIWALLFGVLCLLLARRRETPSAAEPTPPADPADGASTDARPASSPSKALTLVLLAYVLLFVLLFAIPFAMPRGALGVYLQGLLLAGTHVLLAFVFVRGGSRLPALGLSQRPRLGWLLAAPIVGLALRFAGAWLAQIVPSTGVAPVEELVSMPSGMLAFAGVALLAPVAEEIFFRGLVYGALEKRFGAGAAIAGSTVLFALVHLPQQWGAWGACASVLLLGLCLGLLRRYSGSTRAPALAHLAHNAILTLLALG